MVREKWTRTRSKSPRRKKGEEVNTEPEKRKLPLLSDTIVRWYGESYRTPVFVKQWQRSTVDWDSFYEKAEAYLLKHNQRAWEKCKWKRHDLICFFILTETRGECGNVELQLLLNCLVYYAMDELEKLDNKISQLIKDYDLQLHWLGRWLMFHTNYILPFATFDPNQNIWHPRYQSVFTDSGMVFDRGYEFSFAKIPPLDVTKLKRPMFNPQIVYPIGHVMYELNATVAGHLHAFGSRGFQVPLLNGESCFDVLDRDQPGWRQNVENFDIVEGKITPKPQ